MGIIEATRTCFSKYVTFSGRASRPEFWWFLLVYAVAMGIASYLDQTMFGGTVTETVAASDDGTVVAAEVVHRKRPAETLVWLVFFLPVLAAAWRRMQDTGRPGATLLVPLLISIAAGVFLFLGVLGFSLLEMVGLDGQVLRTMAASLGVAGLIVSGGLYVAMRILILWWLTRPGTPQANAFGRRP